MTIIRGVTGNEPLAFFVFQNIFYHTFCEKQYIELKYNIDKI